MKSREVAFRHSLRLRLLIILLAVWLIPTLLLSRFIRQLFPSLREMAESSLTSGAEYAWSQTSDSLDTLIALSRDAVYDGDLADAWERGRQGLLSDSEMVRLSRNYLERKYLREKLILCAVYVPDGMDGDLFLYPRSDADRGVFYQDRVHASAAALRQELDTRCGFLEADGRVYLVRNLLTSSMQTYGMLALEVDFDALTAPLRKTAEDWDAEQWIQLDRIGAADADWASFTPGIGAPSGGFVGYTRVSDSRDWTLKWHMSIPSDRIFGQVQQFRMLLVLLYLLLAAVLLFTMFYTYRRFSRPVASLVDAARRIEDGELGVVVPMHGKDELGTLGRAFSAMSTRLKELIDRNYKEEIALRDARIQALQSRINPHFINNALEDINWQARIDGSEGVSRMVEALSVLLNATMANRDRRTVSLREELNVADAYIFFIRERYGSRLAWEREVDESLLDAAVPLLTLQPVLENAVEHGIAPAGGGAISIRVFREDGGMTVEIRNTGRPLSPEDQERMNAALEGTLEGRHVGLSNISARLRLIYHGRASILASAEDGRTLVRMRIPIEEEKEEDP